MIWANALIALLKRLSLYADLGYGPACHQANVDTFNTASIIATGPLPDVTPQSGPYNLFLRRGLMIHNRNRDKAERWAAAHMAMFNEIYSGADNG